jgi:transcriptional regulator with XRE-family HTH domain
VIGDNLKDLREARDLSRKEVAAYLKIHETTYGNYELGKRQPSLETVQKLAKYYNVSTDQILGNDLPPASDNRGNRSEVDPKEVASIIGQQIMKYRSNLGLSKDDLAAELNVISGRVSAWEAGEYMPGGDMMIKLCEFFSITPNELFGLEKKEPVALSNEQKQKNSDLFSSFTEEQQHEALRFLRYIAQQQEQGERGHH